MNSILLIQAQSGGSPLTIILLLIFIGIVLLLRSVALWYFKINEQIALSESINTTLKRIEQHLADQRELPEKFEI